MNEKTERTMYESIRHHWNEILATARHIVTQFADEAVEVAARAVMLMAPMPNAISVFNITQVQQGFSRFQAFAFSMTIEIVIFFLIEIALLMLTRWLERKPVYRWAFIGMCVVVLSATGIVIRMVYVLEPHKVMSWLPVISLCSFVAIGLKRWDARNHDGGKKPAKSVKPAKIAKADSKANSHERIILNHYMIHPLDSQRVAAESLGMNQAKVNRTLKQLESKGVIHRNGNGVEILREL